MQSEFNKGAAHARDLIIANIIGMQNEESDKDSARYAALQELLEHITDTYGDMMTPFKD